MHDVLFGPSLVVVLIVKLYFDDLISTDIVHYLDVYLLFLIARACSRDDHSLKYSCWHAFGAGRRFC